MPSGQKQRRQRRPAQDRSRATVEAIVQAATYILVERGWERLTTNGIARRAGVNIASLYQYFPNKLAIVAELERRHVEEARAQVTEVLVRHRGPGIDARARTLVDAAIASHSVTPELHRVFAEEMPHGRRMKSKMLIPMEDASEQLSALGVQRPELASWIIAVVVHAVVHEAVLERPADVASGALADELVHLLVRYVDRTP